MSANGKSDLQNSSLMGGNLPTIDVRLFNFSLIYRVILKRVAD